MKMYSFSHLSYTKGVAPIKSFLTLRISKYTIQKSVSFEIKSNHSEDIKYWDIFVCFTKNEAFPLDGNDLILFSQTFFVWWVQIFPFIDQTIETLKQVQQSLHNSIFIIIYPTNSIMTSVGPGWGPAVPGM